MVQSIPVDIGGARIHRPGTLIGKALESRWPTARARFWCVLACSDGLSSTPLEMNY
jgi:hypothetical protein